MSVTEETAREWRVSNDEYHADTTRVSHSAKEMFRNRRRLYEAIFVTKAMPRPEPTPAMVLGSLVDIAVFEPERWANQATEFVAPPEPERAPDGKKWYCRKGSDHDKWWNEYVATVEAARAEWQAENSGKLAVPAGFVEPVNTIREAIYANDKARYLLETDGTPQHTVQWICPETGLYCKRRADYWADAFLLDLKVVNDNSPEPFASKVLSLGYHRQDDFYNNGQEVFANERLPFFFLTVCSKPPHEVAIYDLDDEARKLAHAENLSALQQIKACRESGNWAVRTEREITTLSLPRWARYQAEWEVK